MDMIQEFLETNLSPTLLSTLTTHSATYWRIISTLLTFKSALLRILNPLISRLIDSPDVPTVILLLVVLFVSFKVLGVLWRTFMFWVRMAIQLIIWGTILALVLWVWNRGLDGVSSDLGYVADEFGKEYAGWQRRAERAKIEQRMRTGRPWG